MGIADRLPLESVIRDITRIKAAPVLRVAPVTETTQLPITLIKANPHQSTGYKPATFKMPPVAPIIMFVSSVANIFLLLATTTPESKADFSDRNRRLAGAVAICLAALPGPIVKLLTMAIRPFT